MKKTIPKKGKFDKDYGKRVIVAFEASFPKAERVSSGGHPPVHQSGRVHIYNGETAEGSTDYVYSLPNGTVQIHQKDFYTYQDSSYSYTEKVRSNEGDQCDPNWCTREEKVTIEQGSYLLDSIEELRITLVGSPNFVENRGTLRKLERILQKSIKVTANGNKK